MTWHTNPAVIHLRSLARKAGLTRPLNRLMPNRGYEAAFDDALFATIEAGDTVWDIGANIGHYTAKFGEAVGPQGRVVAFEPFPASLERLRAATRELEMVQIVPAAMGSAEGTMQMAVGGDAIGATNRVVETGGTADATVEMLTGDLVIERALATSPQVIKIDTEGFELDVLTGMTGLLHDSTVSAVFVEVHFGLLADRGQPQAPGEIEALLGRAGFATRWVDPSHIAAERG